MEVRGWAGLALSIKVRGLGGRAAPGPVNKSEGLGRAGPAQAQPIEVRGFGVTGPGPASPPSLATPHMFEPKLCRNRWQGLKLLERMFKSHSTNTTSRSKICVKSNLLKPSRIYEPCGLGHVAVSVFKGYILGV